MTILKNVKSSLVQKTLNFILFYAFWLSGQDLIQYNERWDFVSFVSVHAE